MRFGAYRESKEKQLNGAAIPIGIATFYCRRWGTKESDEAVKKIRLELFGPFTSNAEEQFSIVLAHWLVEYGVVNWENVYEEESEDLLKYSKRLARQTFLNEEYYLSLNQLIFQQACNYENYLHEIAKEDAEEIKKL